MKQLKTNTKNMNDITIDGIKFKKDTYGKHQQFTLLYYFEDYCLEDTFRLQRNRSKRLQKFIDNKKRQNENAAEEIIKECEKLQLDITNTAIRYAVENNSKMFQKYFAGEIDIETFADVTNKCYLRHNYTNYDAMLKNGIDKEDAREEIAERMNELTKV